MRKKPFTSDICRIYKSQAEDLLLFAWVTGIQRVAPGAKIKSCILLFMEHFNLSEDQYPLDTAEVAYHTMKRKFFGCLKTEQE